MRLFTSFTVGSCLTVALVVHARADRIDNESNYDEDFSVGNSPSKAKDTQNLSNNNKNSNYEASSSYGSGGSAGQQQYNREDQKTLLRIDFARDWPQWSPRNPNSYMEWGKQASAAAGLGTVADNGAFEVKKELVKLHSAPFRYNLFNEADVRTKESFAVDDNGSITARLNSACQTFATEQAPLSEQNAADFANSPRLAACRLQMNNINQTLPYFGMAVTNTGVWTYAGDQSGGRFAKKVAVLERYDEDIDVGVEYNRRLGVVNFLLNSQTVYTTNITDLIANGTNVLSVGRSVTVSFGTAKGIDPAGHLAIESNTTNVPPPRPFGQGVIADLYTLKIFSEVARANTAGEEGSEPIGSKKAY